MKKSIFSLLFCLSILFYIGEDQTSYGQSSFVSGVQGEVKAFNMILSTDVRSYINGFYNGFSVDEIWYRVGFGWENIRFFHDCRHSAYQTNKPQSNYGSTIPTNYINISI